MASDDALPVLKILVIGPSGAGKSSLLLRYCDDQFDPESSTATIGIDFKTKKLAVHGKGYRLNIFDTAGQERYRTLSTSYYRGAHGVLVVYDISNRKSFLSLDRWIEEARSNASDNAVIYLVGTKLDKSAPGGTRAVTADEAKAFAESHGAGYCEVSAKTRTNIKQPFVDVVGEIVKRPQLLSGEPSRLGATRALDLSAPASQASSSYCSC